jgi:processive 1,2-diacylglycerol beta-glucosyltransferase
MLHKKVLLLFISSHSGHRFASNAVEQGIKKIEPSAEVLNINAFSYTNPVLEKVVAKTYIGMLKSSPQFWNYLYDNPKVLKNTEKFRELIHKYNSGKLKTLLDKFQPDVVACTQAFPCGMVADYKKTYNLNLPLIAVITDYLPHSYWLYDNIDFYITPPLRLSVDRLVKCGVPQERIRPFGIPIDPVFAETKDSYELKKSLNLSPSVPTILIMGGSQGFGPLREVIDSLEKVEMDLQILVVTGINKRLAHSLQKRNTRRKKDLRILGYVNNVDELMEVSDIIITKPGGLTIAEALAKGLPMITVDSVMGQEANNAKFLIENDVCINAQPGKPVGIIVSHLLRNPARLKQMSERARKFARPYAAIESAHLILSCIKNNVTISSL